MATKGSNVDVFVALLRGVNVGGNNMISMPKLKESFERMGFKNVTTYINSGNIVFKTKEPDVRKLEKKIEQMLAKEYNLDSKVVVRKLAELETLVKSLPVSWNDDSTQSYNVLFLRHTIDSETILDDIKTNSDIEQVVYRPGTLLWTTQKSARDRSEILKLPSRKVGKEITVRNVNTTRKLLDLMKKIAASDD